MQKTSSEEQGVSLIQHYFQQLSEEQLAKFKALYPLYLDWNNKINVISRKDIDELYLKHVLHSLAIAKVIDFIPKTEVLDLGTGGGFPGIPLAIFFPEVNFTLVDAIGKKIKVVENIIQSLELKNANTIHCRAEHVEGSFHFVVTRAVAKMKVVNHWVKNKIKNSSIHPEFENGIFYLKGGDLTKEIFEAKIQVKEFPISTFFSEEFFETKKVVYTNLKQKKGNSNKI